MNDQHVASHLENLDRRVGRRPRHFVYIVRCADGTLYTGYARDPAARAAAHNAGRGARYTAGRGPVSLVYVEPCRSKRAALKREYRLKQWPRSRKEAAIAAAATALPPASRTDTRKSASPSRDR